MGLTLGMELLFSLYKGRLTGSGSLHKLHVFNDLSRNIFLYLMEKNAKRDFSPKEHQKFLFNTILLNFRGAYNEATGIFTTPVNRTYKFAIQVANKAVQWERFNLVCDQSDIILSIAYYNADGHYSSTAGTVAHILIMEQIIWLEFAYSLGTTDIK